MQAAAAAADQINSFLVEKCRPAILWLLEHARRIVVAVTPLLTAPTLVGAHLAAMLRRDRVGMAQKEMEEKLAKAREANEKRLEEKLASFRAEYEKREKGLKQDLELSKQKLKAKQEELEQVGMDAGTPCISQTITSPAVFAGDEKEA